MKKTIIFLFFIFSVFPVFAYDFSALEKRIIMAGPEEMRTIVTDRSMENDLLGIFRRIEVLSDDPEELYTACEKAFPGLAEEDYQIMLLKLILISALGSGDRDNVVECSEMLGFLMAFDSMLEMADPSMEIEAFMNSRYWKDCVGFAALFDSNTFIAERFGEG